MALVESFSGIRGIYGKELTDDIATRYAYCFSQSIKKKKKVVIGRDSRASGENLGLALIEGIDCDIIDVGILPTPAIQHAVRFLNADAGIIITASHNEPEYNGMKFLDKDGAVLRPEHMHKIIENFHRIKDFEEGKFLSKYLYPKNEQNNVKQVEKMHLIAKKEYFKFVKTFFKKKELKKISNEGTRIIIDPNGGAGTIVKELFDEIGVDATYINLDQGRFRRTIEPTEKSLSYLKKEIAKHKAAFGAGFDCDADRVEIMTEQGLVSGNQTLALITDNILSKLDKTENETIVVNDATSYIVKEIVESHQARWKEVEVGEINVVDSMIGYNSPIGGEGSNGGIIFPPSMCRDGTLTLLFLLKILAEKKLILTELIKELPEYYYLKEKLTLKKDFTEQREKVMKYYLDKGFTIQKTGDETGGIKILEENAWIWFRQSKTESKALRIIADSKDKKRAKELIKVAKKIIR